MYFFRLRVAWYFQHTAIFLKLHICSIFDRCADKKKEALLILGVFSVNSHFIYLHFRKGFRPIRLLSSTNKLTGVIFVVNRICTGTSEIRYNEPNRSTSARHSTSRGVGVWCWLQIGRNIWEKSWIGLNRVDSGLERPKLRESIGNEFSEGVSEHIGNAQTFRCRPGTILVKIFFVFIF